VRDAARRTWNRTLGKVRIEGGTEEERKTFYSCLFRASLFPRKFYEQDISGSLCYRSPYDGQVHSGFMYTDTGLWDTFRAQMPLNMLLRPRMSGRYVHSLLCAYEQCGWLPSWSFPGEGGSMIGNHAISVLSDAWVKGIRSFDPAVALAAYKHESSAKGPWGPANGRSGHEELERLGYLPYPKHGEATAKTLEYAYDDFCGFRLAQTSGNPPYEAMFGRRMFNYRNVYDPATGFMRGKDQHGQWTEPFEPTEWGGPYTEGCAWHWVWSVFHDVAGLIALMGGDEQFVARLDAVFDQPGEFHVGTYGAAIHEMHEMVMADMGQYAHCNQPMQHMIYLYNYAGEPWKAQYWARTIMNRLYSSGPDGYAGDEDQGQTSSWYVFSALGIYPVCPGTDEYVLGSPLFAKATINFGGGRRFTITAHDQSADNVYIQSAMLNGEPFLRNFLRHEEIVNGGSLVLRMGPTPNRLRGTREEDKPFSISTHHCKSEAMAESAGGQLSHQ
jgi:predicted alpha-1,2-mannosidase